MGDDASRLFLHALVSNRSTFAFLPFEDSQPTFAFRSLYSVGMVSHRDPACGVVSRWMRRKLETYHRERNRVVHNG
jgi:hypothetical protein